MVMPQNLAAIISGMHPSAVPLVDFEVVKDAEGLRITYWNTQKLGPQPDESAILAAKPNIEAEQVIASGRLQQAIDTCKAYNPSTATAAEVRATLGAALILLRRVSRELR